MPLRLSNSTPMLSSPRPSTSGARPTDTSIRSACTVSPSPKYTVSSLPESSTFVHCLPRLSAMPRRPNCFASSFAASASSWGISVSSISMIVTSEPKRRKIDANSQPMIPPPRTTRRRGTLSCASRPVESTQSGLSSPSIGGRIGNEPVATTADLNVMSSPPSTVIVFASLKLPLPFTHSTPFALNSCATPFVICLTTPAFHSFALPKSSCGSPMLTPSFANVSSASLIENAVCTHAFVGMQPTRRHVPPSSDSFSMHAAFAPSCAAPPVLLHHVSARGDRTPIDGDRASGDETGIREKPGKAPCAQSRRRCRTGRSLRAVAARAGPLGAPDAEHQLGLDRTGSDRVHRDAVVGEVERCGTREADDAGLRSAVGGEVDRADEAGNGRDVHDAPVRSLRHLPRGRLGAVKRSRQIDVQLALPVGGRDLEERRSLFDTCVVDEHVELSELLDDSGHRPLDCAVAYVGYFDHRATADLAHSATGDLGGFSVDVDQGDVGSLAGESQCNRPADALSAAGHQRHLTFEHHPRVTPRPARRPSSTSRRS